MKRYEKFADEIAALIRSGVLAPGEKVVASGQFLLDSEANLRAGFDRLGEAAQ